MITKLTIILILLTMGASMNIDDSVVVANSQDQFDPSSSKQTFTPATENIGFMRTIENITDSKNMTHGGDIVKVKRGR